MKLAVMQPYLFPYLPYFGMIDYVDAFVIYDDAFYIKGGRINRNYIEVKGEPFRFVLPFLKSSPNKRLNEIRVGRNKDFVKTVRQAYTKAPGVEDAVELIERVFENPDRLASRLIPYSIRLVVNYLGIQTPVYLKSEICKGSSLRGFEMIIDICKKMGATTYVNSAGGRKFYKKEVFVEQGLELEFMPDCGPGFSVLHDILHGRSNVAYTYSSAECPV